MNSRSAALSSGPDTPVMNARLIMRPITRGWPGGQHGSRKRPLIPLDDALPASRLQTAPELRRFIGRPERSHHGAVIDALVAEVSTLDQRRTRSQHRRELALQRLIGGLGVGLVTLRGDLNHVSAASATATGCRCGGLCWVGGGHSG